MRGQGTSFWQQCLNQRSSPLERGAHWHRQGPQVSIAIISPCAGHNSSGTQNPSLVLAAAVVALVLLDGHAVVVFLPPLFPPLFPPFIWLVQSVMQLKVFASFDQFNFG